MKYWLLFYGISITVIFGGGFLIRFVRDGDFYLAEFIGGMLGIILLSISFLLKGSMKHNSGKESGFVIGNPERK